MSTQETAKLTLTGRVSMVGSDDRGETLVEIECDDGQTVSVAVDDDVARQFGGLIYQPATLTLEARRG